jgi:RimJ/RimL family protein N-acetyltransferase
MEIRPWRNGDEALAVTAQRHLSAASLYQRFHVGTGGQLPAAYLRHIAAGPRHGWDAQVATVGGQLIGWAEFGRYPGTTDDADLAVLVADPWQRRGVATMLVRALLPRCAEAGVRRLYADVSPDNRAARGLLAALFGPEPTAMYVEGVLRYALPLQTAPSEARVPVAVLVAG